MEISQGDPGPSARAAGSVALAAGAVTLLAYPWVRGAFEVGYDGWYLIRSVSPLLSCLGAVASVWGLSTVVTGRYDSLTPARAVAVPVLVTVPFGLGAFVVPEVTDFGAHEPPATVLELTQWVLAGSRGMYVAAAAALVFAVARSADRRLTARRTRLLVAGYVIVLLVASPGLEKASTVFSLSLGPLALAALCVAVGRRLATRPTDAAVDAEASETA